MSIKTATAIIDLKALDDNYTIVKKLVPQGKVLAVLKANAYGHGLEKIAKALPQADAFGVARIDEALALRASGVVKPIVLLEGFFDANDLDIIAINNLQTIIHNEPQLKAILSARLERAIKVWLKVDTGMHRLGIEPENFQHYYQQLQASSNVQSDIVLMSHLGCADDKISAATTEQIQLFEQLTQTYSEEKSLANSAGLVSWPHSHYQWVRPGLVLYGVSPFAVNEHHENTRNLRPVMTLKSSLIAIRELNTGETVGYGAAWRCQQKTRIGVVAIGYGDGYPRHARNGTPVFVNGRRVPLVGRVSMDMITVDLGLDSQDSIGDIVTLWGNHLPVEEVAACATTIPYELLCNISRRVKVVTES